MADPGGREPLEAIVARSYAPHKLQSILGRSALHRKAPEARPLPAKAGKVADRLENYEKAIEQCSARYGLDAALLKAVIYAESGGDHRALSSRGAAGLMQLMPETAAELGVEDPFDPEQNIASGARYLKSLIDRFGSVELALWAYNAGPRAVEEDRLPAETRAYVPRVLALRRLFKDRTGE